MVKRRLVTTPFIKRYAFLKETFPCRCTSRSRREMSLLLRFPKEKTLFVWDQKALKRALSWHATSKRDVKSAGNVSFSDSFARPLLEKALKRGSQRQGTRKDEKSGKDGKRKDAKTRLKPGLNQAKINQAELRLIWPS